MFILIEVDGNWTIGLDWYKYVKGVRLGFVAIHIIFMKYHYVHNVLELAKAKSKLDEVGK